MTITVRRLKKTDFENWSDLWKGYCGEFGQIPDDVTQYTFERMLEEGGKVGGFLAVDHKGVALGLVNYIFHPSTFTKTDRCYLEDLFTTEAARGKGVGRKLIEAVSEEASKRGADKLYWHTEETNYRARMLYDQVATKKHISYARKLNT